MVPAAPRSPANGYQGRVIEIDGVAEMAKIADRRLHGRRRVAVGDRRNARVERFHPELDRLDIRALREPHEVVGMEGERPFPDRRLDRRNQGTGPLRGEDAAGVLDHDRVDAGALDELSRLRCVERVGVDRALAEDEPTDGVRAEGFRVQEPLGEIVEVVQAVVCIEEPGS